MTNSNVRYVGLDVHKRVVEACLVDQAGKILRRERFGLNRNALATFAKCVLRPADHAALEATTNCWAVADALRPHVARVVVSNPLATKAIAQAKVKTDKVDAHVLAQLLRCDFLPEVWQPDEATRQLRELTGRRSALVGQRTRMRNRIHSVLAMRLIDAPLRLFNAEGLAWLATVELDEQARLLVESDLRQLEFLQQESELLDAELARRGHASDAVKLLMTLPGVDVTTATALLAAWGDVNRFPDGDHAASYLGLTPSTKQSANQCYHGPITKRGNSTARWMLIEAAQHLDKHPGPLGHFFRRLLPEKEPQRGGGGRRTETGGDRLADAGQRAALPLRPAQEHGNETREAAGEGHGRAAQGRHAQGTEGRGHPSRRSRRHTTRQVLDGHLPQRGPARAAAAFARRAADRERGRLCGVRRPARRRAGRAAPHEQPKAHRGGAARNAATRRLHRGPGYGFLFSDSEVGSCQRLTSACSAPRSLWTRS